MTIIEKNFGNRLVERTNSVEMSQSRGDQPRMTLFGVIIKLTVLFGIALFPSISFAAINVVTIKTNPDTPGPNQETTVSLESFAVDLDSSVIMWYVDKEIMKSGIGEKSIQTKTKNFGETTTIDVVISNTQNGRIDKQLLLTPVEVDLLWEADTVVPPFYKGKALPTYKSLVRVIAVPRFNASWSDPAIFNYSWTANNIQGIGQGLGKNSAVVPMKYSGSTVPVRVMVNGGGSTNGSGSATINITAVDPLLLFYENEPLLGTLFERALTGAISTPKTEFRVRAVPYYFSYSDYIEGLFVYDWKQNSQATTPNSNQGVLVVAKNGLSEQTTSVELTVSNRKRVLQNDSESVVINFTEEQ